MTDSGTHRERRGTTSSTERASRPALSVGELALTLGFAGVAVLLAASRRLERKTADRVEALLAWASAPAEGTVTDANLEDLPTPVRRYLETVLDDDQSHVETARLTQRGEIRLGETWKPFTATQHVSVDPPGFVWDATVAVLSMLTARVVDGYEDGAGSLSAWLLSTLPIARAEPTPAVSEGELLRYLGESVWYPTALLSDAVEWSRIDDRSAMATIADGRNVAYLEFRFDDRDLVESVHADVRYRQEDDSYAPWTGRFDDYRERNGMLIPVEATVEWNLPEGDLVYWRGRIESIEHEFVA